MSTERNVNKVTIPVLQQKKESGEKISALTAYDFLMAEMIDQAGIDLILVGDSAAMVVAGESDTLKIGMEEMLYHTRIVAGAVQRAFVVGDMPFLSYQPSQEQAIQNAGKFLKAGAEAVKIEGGAVVAPLVKTLTSYGIPVLGHIGLTPQSVHQLGGYKTRGTSEREANILMNDALQLQDAGAFAVVLEKIPESLAQKITNSLSIPTIGIGAGKYCDGQILVSHDMLGIYDKFKPRFVRRYAELGKLMREAFAAYQKDVSEGHFPSDKESFK
ncbi:MAG: 3-methyl-2-oxobutanoate hydroxymethyltransferase [Calditrichia bacterium]